MRSDAVGSSSSSPSPRPELWERIAELHHAVGEVSACDLDGLMAVLADRLACLTRADACSLFMGLRDPNLPSDHPLHGWRAHNARVPHGAAEHEAAMRALSDSGAYTGYPQSIALARGAGTVRAALRFDLIDPEAWAGSPAEAHFAALGISDHLIGVCPVYPDTELYVTVSRVRDRTPFGPQDRDHLKLVLERLTVPARRIALSFGGRGGQTLSPRERETLSWLLQGLAEKQIAEQMALSRATVHEYVVGVYRKLAVGSRPELMALWLRGG